jgi:hypothetical protein
MEMTLPSRAKVLRAVRRIRAVSLSCIDVTRDFPGT